jgi:hypothetical protein
MTTPKEAKIMADLTTDLVREIARAKTPTTFRLKDAVEDVLFETSPALPPGPKRDELERVAMALAYDAEHGVEQVGDSVIYVEELLATLRGA